MTKLVLVNAGETDWDQEHRIEGTIDVPLSKKGEERVINMTKKLDLDIDVIYTSKLSRAFKTAEIINGVKDIKFKTKIVKGLNAINQGVWQGLLVQEARKRYKKIYSKWESHPMSVKPPQGESLAEAYERIITTTQKITRKHISKNICLVTHRIVNSLIKSHYLNLDIDKIWETLEDTIDFEILELNKNGDIIQ